jgi:membrane-associated protease RseP (regulator of RpoE activity)
MTESAPRRWALSVALFAATCFTTTATGALNRHGAVFPLSEGLAYSIPLMAILLCHELGHYVVARLHGVPASPPFFIPMPPGFGPLGTMGAVILQGSTADRRKLIDIGAAGPLAGLAVAVPVVVWGLAASPVKPLSGLGLQEGNSILYLVLKHLLKGEWLPSDGRDVILHPTAFAGWAGLFVTMLNLIPIGQLDGGHVATAYFGNRWERAARAFHLALPVLALVMFAWVYVVVSRDLGGADPPEGAGVASIAAQPVIQWMIWFVLLGAMKRAAGGRYHPPVDDRPLPPSRRALFWAVAVAFVLTFMPVPLRFSVGVPSLPGKGAPDTQGAAVAPAGAAP